MKRFTFKHYVTGLFAMILYLNLQGLGAAQEAAPGAATDGIVPLAPLTSVQAMPSNNIIFTKGNYNIVFNTATAGAIKKIEAKFPANFNLTNAKLIETAGIGAGSITISGTTATGQTLTYTLSSLTPPVVPANTKIRLMAGDIINNGATAAQYVAVTTKDSGGITIDGPTNSLNPALVKVSASMIADNAVNSLKIADGSIATADIADGSVTSAKIAPAAIGPAQLSNDSVWGAHILDGQVGVADLAFDPATQAELDTHKLSPDHDGRYYTEAELNTAGVINTPTNPVDWTQLKNVPADFSDGIDNTGTGIDISRGLFFQNSQAARPEVQNGNVISFGHNMVSEDQIYYENNKFHFRDSPGGADTLEPSIEVGGINLIGGSNVSGLFFPNSQAARPEVQNGNVISFGHTMVSGDQIYYENNKFHFRDSPGGLDATEPSIEVGGINLIGGSDVSGLYFPGSYAPPRPEVQNGNVISFAHPWVSEDQIYYRDNIFYFRDAPGGGDTSDPSIEVGGIRIIGNSFNTAGQDISGLYFPFSYAARPEVQNGNVISFAHPGTSEDQIYYSNNTFHFRDSPGGVDTLEPFIEVGAIRIIGGADIAEPFKSANADDIRPGMVVAIDRVNPEQLKVAEKAYDKTVAGIVSGANGINPGVTMMQEGSAADGTVQVAMTGRVYAWVDASYGEVEPGDMLTTSDTSGHAMKVSDHAKAQGAIIGKAMTSLKEGKGLVLVLVTLQ